MKKIVSLTLCAVIVLSFFTGCKEKETDDEYSSNTKLETISDYDYSKFKGQDITLNVANWGEYMSVQDEDYLDVNDAFEELTGVEVNYKTYATNEELYAKIKSGGADYDIIIPSDYMISRMAGEGMLQKLNYDNIPNKSYINEKLVNSSYDPANEYSVPYMWGVVCLIYNTTMIDEEIDSWNALWDEKYENDILMFNNPRDAFGIALIREGSSINTEDKEELKQALEALKEQKPFIQAYVMDEIFDKMEGGSSAIAPYYSGDAVTMMDENSDLTAIIPKEGTSQFVDAICIPTVANNKEVAEMYINFLCETEVAFANCDYIGYSTPHDGAFELLDEDVKNNPLQYPTETYESFDNLSDETNEYTQQLWNELKIEKPKTKYAFLFIPIILVLAIFAIVFINVKRAKKKKLDIL